MRGIVHASVDGIAVGGFHIPPAVGFYMPARILVAFGVIICAFFGAGLRRFNRRGVDDIYPPFGYDDVLCLKLAIDLTQQYLPQIVFHQLLAKAPDGGGIRYIATQFEVAEFAEKQVAKQGLGKLHIAQPIPDAQQRCAQQCQQRITRPASLAGVNPGHYMLKSCPVQHCLSPVQPLQAGVLKIGAGYEKFGLGGKWLLHGPNLAKSDRNGNPIVMQRLRY